MWNSLISKKIAHYFQMSFPLSFSRLSHVMCGLCRLSNKCHKIMTKPTNFSFLFRVCGSSGCCVPRTTLLFRSSFRWPVLLPSRICCRWLIFPPVKHLLTNLLYDAFKNRPEGEQGSYKFTHDIHMISLLWTAIPFVLIADKNMIRLFLLSVNENS